MAMTSRGVAMVFFGAIPATLIVVGAAAITLPVLFAAPEQLGLSIIPLLAALVGGVFGVWSLWWSAINRGRLPFKHKVGLIVGIAALLGVSAATALEISPLAVGYKIGSLLTLGLGLPIVVAIIRLIESSKDQPGS